MRPAPLAVPCLVAALLAATPLAAQAPPALRTTELGKGPTIVLLPGLGLGRMEWMPTARKLVGGHHVVMVDLPGQGDSPALDPLSVEGAAAALQEVLRKHAGDSTVVVGQGVGGTIAIVSAKKEPSLQRGVIVIDASLLAPLRNPGLASRRQASPEQIRKMLVAQMDQDFPGFAKFVFTRMGRDSTEGARIYAKTSLVPQPVMRSYITTLFMDLDVTSSVKDFPLPLLYLGTSRAWPDTLPLAELSRNMGYDAKPDLQARRVADAGYIVMADQPDTLAAIISEFSKAAIAGRK